MGLKKAGQIQRLGTYGIDEVLNQIVITGNFLSGKKAPRHKFGDYEVRMTSRPLQVYRIKGITCYICGLKGQFFALERFRRGSAYHHRPHLRLYAVDDHGDEVLMTVDHVFPESDGGRMSYKNLEPCCRPYNCKRAEKHLLLIP